MLASVSVDVLIDRCNEATDDMDMHTELTNLEPSQLCSRRIEM